MRFAVTFTPPRWRLRQLEELLDFLQNGDFEHAVALEQKASELADTVATSAPGLAGGLPYEK